MEVYPKIENLYRKSILVYTPTIIKYLISLLVISLNSRLTNKSITTFLIYFPIHWV